MQIFLIGMMGSGKTTVARALCKYVQAPQIDLDHEIEINANKKIAHIFAEDGEVVFRELETLELKKEREPQTIISTGGGIVESVENRLFLQEQLTVFLSGDEDLLWQRINGDENRPLAQEKDIFKERYQRRQSLYKECARYTVDINEKTINDIVSEILFIIAKEEARG